MEGAGGGHHASGPESGRERRGSVIKEGEIRDCRGKCPTGEGEIRQERGNE